MTAPHTDFSEIPPPAENTAPAEVSSAATLTSARERSAQGPDGDTVFVLACQLGKHGPHARQMYLAADAEADQDGPVYTHTAITRLADRIIELINATSETP